MALTPYTNHYLMPFPDPGSFGSRFGVLDSAHPTPHRGTDFIEAEGTPIPAVATGRVEFTQWSNVLGRVTVTSTKLQKIHKRSSVLYIGYCHQSAQLVTPGQVIQKGSIIGKVGGAIVDGKHTSGSAATGSHLHLTFSFLREGVFAGDVFDPIPWIRAHDGR